MDPAFLTDLRFWSDPAMFSFGKTAAIAGVEGHVLFETSGSSGIPKMAALSKSALLGSAMAVNRHLHVTAGSCWGLALPIHHVGGFGVAARAFEARCRFEHFNPRWEPVLFRDWLQQGGVTHTSLVPTQVHDLVRANQTAPATLRAVVVGGGHLDQGIGQAARDLGWPVLASYGMTEAASQIATQGLELLEMPYQTTALPLLSHWQARVGPDGILSVAGPALFSGYVIDAVFHPRQGDWHITADRVLLDERLITPLGRADNVIKILGELVDPEAIEREIIASTNGLLLAGSFAIVAIPDERAGFLLVPVFESSELLDAATSTLAACSANAPGYRRLQTPVVIENFPRSELGKARRGELAAICSYKLTKPRVPPA